MSPLPAVSKSMRSQDFLSTAMAPVLSQKLQCQCVQFSFLTHLFLLFVAFSHVANMQRIAKLASPPRLALWSRVQSGCRTASVGKGHQSQWLMDVSAVRTVVLVGRNLTSYLKKIWSRSSPPSTNHVICVDFVASLELPAQHSTTTTTTTTTTQRSQQRPHQQQQRLTIINGKPPREVFFLNFFMLCLFFLF